jgi:hypothetical protein
MSAFCSFPWHVRLTKLIKLPAVFVAGLGVEDAHGA